MKQNITLSLDRDLLARARVLAARRSTSVSALLADELAQLVEEADVYEHARRSAEAHLQRGLHLGGMRAARETLHER